MVVGVVRVGEWRLGAGSRHAGTGLLDARRRTTEDRRRRADGREKENIEYRTPTDSIGTGKEYRMTKGEGRQKTIDSRHKTED